MIEFTYYKSGHWRAVCTVCGAGQTFDSIVPADRFRQTHARECGT